MRRKKCKQKNACISFNSIVYSYRVVEGVEYSSTDFCSFSFHAAVYIAFPLLCQWCSLSFSAGLTAFFVAGKKLRSILCDSMYLFVSKYVYMCILPSSNEPKFFAAIFFLHKNATSASWKYLPDFCLPSLFGYHFMCALFFNVFIISVVFSTKIETENKELKKFADSVVIMLDIIIIFDFE